MEIYNENCLCRLAKLPIGGVDMVLVDLPYGQTACKWDTVIDLTKMWEGLEHCCKDNCIYVFFCTVKFGNTLINSNPKWFRYDLIWEKTRSLGFMSAKKMPLRKHEMIYVFSRNNRNDVEIKYNLAGRAYSKKVMKFIGKTNGEIKKDMGNGKAQHFFSHSTSQFEYPTKETYEKLTKMYKLEGMEGFMTHDQFEKFKRNTLKKCYNPQMTKGKPYKSGSGGAEIYGIKKIQNINKGTRYPTSILKFGYDKEKFHPTQKPVALCEWLVKTYSNKGETVLDFTMGSGSSGVACKNTDRKFIGIEMDKDIFEIAKKRLINC